VTYERYVLRVTNRMDLVLDNRLESLPMKQWQVSSLLILVASCLVTPANALNKEFNWIPSGVLDVGDRASEATGKYEAVGELQMLDLGYRGEAPQKVTARLIDGAERFVIRPASWRLGPAPAHLVIRRQVDTGQVPGVLTVKAEGQVVGEWTITPPEGPRRLYDALFVIPRSHFPKDQPPAEVHVTIESGQPALSLGYRFYATRDWDLLGPLTGDVRAALAKAGVREKAYLRGLLAEGDHDWEAALKHFEEAASFALDSSDTPNVHRLACIAVRRAKLRIARAAADTAGERAFDVHYRLGLLAGAWGCWDDALEEFRLAVEADPTHADATYRLAEAMEYNRLPIADWAPIYERAGILGETPDCNIEDVLVAVHTEPVEALCGQLSRESLETMQRNWRYVEQMVYGASLGAWKLNTTYMICGPECPEWVMQAGWIFLPPEEAVEFEGKYGYSIGTAEFGSSHAGGVDCGVRGAGGSQIGPTRGWEVWLHEWNHQFDWTFLFSESGPGYPVTHDSDGCGKQPIVSMGCGHRSSMRYYVTRAQYRRHRASDPVVSEACIRNWTLGPVVAAPAPDSASPEGLETWLVQTKRITERRLEQLRREWEGAKKAEKQQTEKPPVVKSYPAPKPVPDWPGFLRQQWNRTKLLDELTTPKETAFVQGDDLPKSVKAPAIQADGDFVDLLATRPTAPDKCAGYARTYIYSPADQEVRLWLGYNDTAAVWLNGQQINTGRYYACAKWEDQNRPYMLAQAGYLKEGWNCLAVKVERGGGNWGFSVHVVDFDNQPVDGLVMRADLPAGERANRYAPPPVGPHYRWADVKDDYLNLLPRLSERDLADLTGIEGLRVAKHRFLLMLPSGVDPLPGSHFIGDAMDGDTWLNNYLNWDMEAAAALRYRKNGQDRDLLIVRPEYYEEFLSLLQEDEALASPAKTCPADRLLGYLFLPETSYDSTPNRPFTGRAVLVLDTMLGTYPFFDLDLLGVR